MPSQKYEAPRRVFLVATLLAGVACAPAPTAPVPTGKGAEILWDSYGVPHIYARDRQALAYAFGWAQMRNHSDLLLRLYLQGRGRASELLGKAYVDDDKWVWTLGIPDRAARDYALQSPEMHAHIEAFVAGINAFAAQHPELIGDSVKAVLPVTAADVTANLMRLTYARFLTSREGAAAEARAWERGSNAWAVAPSRSASGHTLLLQNPHLPWGDIFTWMEGEYSMPGMDVYGATLVGNPVLQIAFNENVGWTHTVNTQDEEDTYELTLAPGGYMYNGAARAFEESAHVLKVATGAATFSYDTLRLRRSVQGPIVGMKTGKALALRVVGLDPPLTPYAYEQWWNMGRAHNLAEFQAAIRPNQISGQNITYGDREGHIMMFYGGNSPVRSRGDRAFWAGVIPGDSSWTLWTALHPFKDMPVTLDPPSGWVQNANNPPWWSTFPVTIHASDFPSYFGPVPMALRPQRSIHILQSDSSITYSEFLRYKHSTRMELADRLMNELLAVSRASSSENAKRGADVLEQWDRSADASSRGAVLFTEWWREYGRRMGAKSRFATPWSEQRPLDTPAGLADPAIAVAALDAVVSGMGMLGAALDIPWGSVYRLRRDSLDLPANGAQDALGVFRVVSYASIAGNKYVGVSGDSYVAAIEFSNPLRAMSLVTYGNASRAGSPHRTDQLPLFAREELKPVWRTRAEVEAHTELREKF